MAWTREQGAAHAAREIRDDFYCNLGIGIPTLVANYIAPGVEVTLHSENGMLGLGPFPTEGEIDADVINAGKQTITELAVTSYVSSAECFAMIGVGHIDLSILGAVEVSGDRDMANWMVPGKLVKGPGGAMDHTTRDGGAKFPRACTLPLTGRNVVDMIISDLAVFIRPDRSAPFAWPECVPGVTEADVRVRTQARYPHG